MREHHVDHRGARASDDEAGFTGVVVHADHRAFEAQEHLARGQALGGGDLANEIQTLKGMLLDAAAHLMERDKKRNSPRAQSGKWKQRRRRQDGLAVPGSF
jgi:hypothetical protein